MRTRCDNAILCHFGLGLFCPGVVKPKHDSVLLIFSTTRTARDAVRACPSTAAGARVRSAGGGEYAYFEYYCDEIGCDCRRVILEVIGRKDPDRVLATIGFGWEKESFYRKKMPWNPDEARGTISGELDPLCKQSEFAPAFLQLFQDGVLNESYRLRLRRHYRMFKEELARRGGKTGG